MKTKSMIICAVFSAVLCVFCVMTVPIGTIPVSMATFAVMLVSVIIGPKLSAVSVAVYILLGSAGLPVYSGFKGGFQILAGPTGGYIWSYIFMALLVGSVTKKYPQSKILSFLACLAGTLICYLIGTAQFMLVQNTSFASSLAVCVFPFIPFDIIKSISAVIVGDRIKNKLIRAKLI